MTSRCTVHRQQRIQYSLSVHGEQITPSIQVQTRSCMITPRSIPHSHSPTPTSSSHHGLRRSHPSSRTSKPLRRVHRAPLSSNTSSSDRFPLPCIIAPRQTPGSSLRSQVSPPPAKPPSASPSSTTRTLFSQKETSLSKPSSLAKTAGTYPAPSSPPSQILN